MEDASSSMAKAGCPCIDSSLILSPQSNCIRSEDGTPGIWTPFSTPASDSNSNTTITGACFPVTYGANECAAYDIEYDPRCYDNDNPPGYCQERWCYVDRKACKDSTEFFFLSSLYDDLYYSYDTCNATADEWLAFDSTNDLDGLQLSVAVPAVLFPSHYKLSSTGTGGEVAEFKGSEYYDDSVPWLGWQLEYFNDIAALSNIGEVSYTYQSRGSDIKSPNSSWTATVHDIQAGISCLAVSNFWITAQRLKLTTFTTPITAEKLYMFIQSPGAAASSGSTLVENIQKTLAPFEPNLWFLTLGLLVVVAILSVLFANQQGELSLYWETMKSPQWKKASYLRRVQMFSKMGLESFLIKTTYAVTQSAGVNTHNSMAQKFTNVGFAFLILILVSAYTANLAAFLTVSLAEQVGYIKNMQDAIARGAYICSSTALKDDLSQTFPDANFLYFDNKEERLKAYDAGKCSVILYPVDELVISRATMKDFCKRDLVMTGPPVLEIPVGFPVCSHLAGGISHWIYEAQKRGITYMSYFEQNLPQPICSFDIPDNTGDSDMARLTVEDFTLPLLVFVVCIGLAILCHVLDWKTRNDKKTHHNNYAAAPPEQSRVMSSPAMIQRPTTEKTGMNIVQDAPERDDSMAEIEILLERMAAVVAKQKGAQKDVYV